MKALIWKEWREQRIFLLIAVGIIILSGIGDLVFLKIHILPLEDYIEALENINDYNFFLGWIIIPSLFALILGAVPFSREFSNNTQDFLLNRPITTAKIFWLKFFFGLLHLLFIILLFRLVLYVPPSSISKEPCSPVMTFTLFYLPFIFAYCAVFFTSFLVKKDLPSILISPFITGFGIFLILPLYLIFAVILPSKYWKMLFERLIFIAPACVLIAIFLLYSFFIWQKAISKGMKSTKIFFSITGLIFLFYFLTHTLLNISTGLELRRTIRRAEESGIKLNIEEIIPPPIPDEENAALVYQEAFELLRKLYDKYNNEEERYMPWNTYNSYSFDAEGVYRYYDTNKRKFEELTPEQKKTITQLVLKDKDFIKFYNLIEDAVNLPKCRFDIKYEEWPNIKIGYLGNMRGLERLVAVRTYILTEENRYKEAWESVKLGFEMGKSLKESPELTAQLGRIASDGTAMESFQLLINKNPEAIPINDYKELLAEIESKKDITITKGLEGELVIPYNYFFKRMLKNDVSALSGYFGPFTFLWKIYTTIGNPLLKKDTIFYIYLMSDTIQLSCLPYYKAKNRIDKMEKEIEWFYPVGLQHPFSSLMFPAITRALESQAQYNARLDGLKITCALKIYKKQNGYYPDELISLVPDILSELPLDPFTGENFIYRKQGKGFILYSLGPNEKDDDGISYKENSEKSKEKDYDREAYDIVWKCEK